MGTRVVRLKFWESSTCIDLKPIRELHTLENDPISEDGTEEDVVSRFLYVLLENDFNEKLILAV